MSLSAGGRGAVSVWRTWAEESEVRTHFVAVLVRGELFAVRSVLDRRGSDGVHTNSARRPQPRARKPWTFPLVRHEVLDNIHTAETRGRRAAPSMRLEHQASHAGAHRPSLEVASTLELRRPAVFLAAPPRTRTGAIVGSEPPSRRYTSSSRRLQAGSRVAAVPRGVGAPVGVGGSAPISSRRSRL